MRHFALASASVILLSLAFTAGCSSASDKSGTGGSSNGGATANGGGTSTGGSSGGATANGGSTSTTGGAGGATSTGGSGGAAAQPTPCLNNETKGGTCTTQVPEGQSCSKTCGPKSVGWKAETCTSGLYVEGTCQYAPGGDYSCFKLPATLPACTTAATAVQSGQPCDIMDCQPCGPNYLDSKGTAKTGYCVCAGGDGTVGKGSWSCASATAWPPQ